MMATTQMEMLDRYPDLTMPTAERSALRRAVTYLIWHYIERPVKRTARRIAYSGYWSEPETGHPKAVNSTCRP